MSTMAVEFELPSEDLGVLWTAPVCVSFAGAGAVRSRVLPAAVASATTAFAPAIARSFGSLEAGFGSAMSAILTFPSSMPYRP